MQCILIFNKRLYVFRTDCSQQTAITNTGPLPSVISEYCFNLRILYTSRHKLVQIIFPVLDHMSVIMMETPTEDSSGKKAATVSLSKPMRAAGCETKQPSHVWHLSLSLCGCWYSCKDLPLKWQQLFNPSKEFELVYNARHARPFICNAVVQGWMNVRLFFKALFISTSFNITCFSLPLFAHKNMMHFTTAFVFIAFFVYWFLNY